MLVRAFSPPAISGSSGSCQDFRDGRFYQSLRSSTSITRRLCYLAPTAQLDFWRQDGLSVLAPTKELLADGNQRQDWNDASYVVLHRAEDRKTLFAGDTHDGTWAHLIDNHANELSNLDLLIAPHHGRISGRSFDFLDVLRPKLTLFGYAPSRFLSYDPWQKRGLQYITNNQAGSIVHTPKDGKVFVTNLSFAKRFNASPSYDSISMSYEIGSI